MSSFSPTPVSTDSSSSDNGDYAGTGLSNSLIPPRLSQGSRMMLDFLNYIARGESLFSLSLFLVTHLFYPESKSI